MPFYYDFDNELSKKVDKGIRKAKTNFLIGSPSVESTKDEIYIFNRAFMLDQFSAIKGTYDKTHLVPFGEYVPFGKYLKFLGKLTQQAGNFSVGKKDFKPLIFKDKQTGVLICFEILFPSISRKFVKNGADILTTITNDAWFGYSSAPLQHFSIGVFRAVENRRSFARAANTGISGFIDPKGKIIQTTKLFEDRKVFSFASIIKDKSVYTKYGDVFAIMCTIAICLIFVVELTIKKSGDKLL